MKIHILLNGEPTEVPAECTLAELIRARDLRPEQVAVEVNKSLVTRDQRESTLLREADHVELVTLVGGG